MERRPELFLELARLIGTETLQNSNVEDYDKTRLGSLQYLRLPADYSGEPSLERLEYLCQKANESQCLYRSISLKQWLRTVIAEQEGADPIIYSNVVPRQAYLRSACPEPQHCLRGFFLPSEIPDGLDVSRRCINCALANQMKNLGTDHMAVDQLNTPFLQMEEEVEDVQDLARGLVYKILCRNGIFVRKRFNCEPIFDRELKVVTEVSHPNIVHCFGCFLWPDSGDDSWDCDMFMEFLDVDLQRLLIEQGEGSGSPFSFQDSLDVLLQVAEAMSHLHEMNFLHGDLKPQNIFMSRFELAHSSVHYYLVKVGDFGCAQRVDSSGATVDPFCHDIGTTPYIAPEVLRCRPTYYGGAPPPEHPQKIDVYSFGVVAYQVLTGVTRLYVGYKQSRIPEEVIRGLRPDIGFEGTLDGERSSLLPYIKRCWAENPKERPSFSQICDELNRLYIEHGHRENNAKRKHHDSIAEGTNFVKCMKTTWAGSCQQALSDETGMALNS